MKKTKNKKNLLLYGGIGVLLLLLIAYVVSNSARQREEDAINALFDKEINLDVQEFNDQGTEHISEPGKFTYNSNPPTSGPHYAQAPAWGFYPDPIDDESAIHAIEHGGVWVSYKNLEPSEIDLLKEFVDTNPQSVIVTPREKNDSRISAAAWTKLVNFENVDTDALQKFLLLNKNKTHEPLAR